MVKSRPNTHSPPTIKIQNNVLKFPLVTQTETDVWTRGGWEQRLGQTGVALNIHPACRADGSRAAAAGHSAGTQLTAPR